MKSEDTSLFEDPTTPSYVRDLLQAGRRASAEYDVERGLAKHLAAISAAPAASWAPTTVTTVTKVWPSWIGFAAVPLAAASVAGLLWVYSADRPAPAVNGVAGSAVTPPAQAPDQAPGVNAAPAAVRPTVTRDERDERYEDEARPSLSERRRSGARPNAVRGSRVASRATGEGDLEGAATGSTEAQAIDTRAGDGARKGSAAVEPSVATSKIATDSRSVQGQAQTTEASSQRTAVAREQREQEEESARAEAAPEPARSGRDETGAAAKPAPVIDESRLEREMQMLAVTQRVLASDPARALRLSEQGEREFRGSMFSAERRQLGLLALVKLGRVDEARRAGRPFLARYPKAPWSERLARALATGVVE